MKLKIRNIIFNPSSIFLEKRLRNKSSKILVIGTPIHKNLGDHLIAINEITFLNRKFGKKNVIEIPTDIFFDNESSIVQNTQEDAVIILTGGGWMGDLWPDDEYRMQRIISDYKNHKIIIFPQTVYYSNYEDNKIIEDAKNTYRQCNDLILLLRDRESYEYACAEFGNVIKQIILVPDMGLYGFYKEYKDGTVRKIGLCLREDRERVTGFGKNKIKEFLLSNGYKVNEFSTICEHGVPVWLRKWKVKRTIQKVRTFDCVVTDRLHGMVFSVISGIKCIAIDNKTHKVLGVYNEWLKSNNNVLITNMIDAETLLDELRLIEERTDEATWRKKVKSGFKTIDSILSK